MLSVAAGCTEGIGFLVGLNVLFTAHITGNLVILAAQIAGGVAGQISKILSVPVFILMVSLAVLLADGLEPLSVVLAISGWWRTRCGMRGRV
jgi:uncharacterized membrane protein YoaK (UPF0700 family)